MTQTPTVSIRQATSRSQKSNDRWPFIRWAEKERAWKVDARTKDGGQRRFFTNKDEAMGWADSQRVRRQNQGDHVFDDRELAQFGLTVADAIKFTLDHYRRQATSAPVDEVVRQLIESKKAFGRAESYLYLLTLNLRKVSEHFDGRMIPPSPRTTLSVSLPDFRLLLRHLTLYVATA